MRIRATAAIATVLLCAASSASTQPADPGKGVEPLTYGAGNRSCGKWLADRGNNVVHNVDLSWVLGWLSAAGGYSWALSQGRTGPRHTDADAVSAWLDKYCREHPLDSLGAAAANLVNELTAPQ